MIWVHTYGFGKFKVEKVCKTIHDNRESAEKNMAVLGGTITEFMSEEEVAVEKYHIAQAVRHELSDIIDDFSKLVPVLYGSSEWDCKKLKACNMVNQIIEGDF